MARQASGRLRVSLDVMEEETGLGATSETSRLRHLLELVEDLANGTADGEIDRVYSDELALTTTPTDLDLVGTAVTSELSGDAISLAEIVGIVILNTSSAGNVQVGGDANAIPIFGAAADYLIVPPGGAFVWYAPAGITLTAGTGDILQLAASAGTVNCRIGLVGRSA